ncbi:MAG: FliM/FliN family flagellar motor switch protein [Candidatus Latescibacterota bacterium]
MSARHQDGAARPVRFPSLTPSPARVPAPDAVRAPQQSTAALGRLREVPVKITVEWGRTEVPVEEAARLAEGGLLRLDELAGRTVDVRVNGSLFGRGTLVLVGGTYGVRLTEVTGRE